MAAKSILEVGSTGWSGGCLGWGCLGGDPGWLGEADQVSGDMTVTPQGVSPTLFSCNFCVSAAEALEMSAQRVGSGFLRCCTVWTASTWVVPL